MREIVMEVIQDGNIEPCRELCNELMALQKSKAFMQPELFDGMNFDTRMKKSHENALRSQTVLCRDNGVPVGYVFSTIDDVTEADRVARPAWAPIIENSIGFYPDWVTLPQKIGCLSNLYLRDGYRNGGLGARLCDTAMEWLGSFPDCRLAFVYISNGNDAALDFYIRKGFVYSHEVFGGFIKAAYCRF